MRGFFVGTVAVVVAGMVLAPAPGRLIVVPRDAQTIQGGLDLSAAGDTVLVQPGTYLEHVVFPEHDVSLASLHGPEVTAINGMQSGTPVTIDRGDHLGSVLAGLALRRGHATDGGGLRISGASPTIRDNIIANNHSTDDGGGIFVEEGGAPRIVGNRISENSAGSSGAALELAGAGFVVVEGNEINENSGYYSAAISVQYSDGLILRDNLIDGNSSDRGPGGVSISSCDTALVVGGSVSWNSGGGNGGGVWIRSTPIEIRDLEIVGNHADFSGGGIYLSDYAADEDAFLIFGCRIVGNSASSRGGGIYSELGAGRIEHCTIAGNRVDDPSDSGAGVYLRSPDSVPLILGSIIAANEPDGIYGYDYYDMVEVDLIRNLMWGHSGGHYGNVRPGAWDIIADPLPIAPDSLDWRLRADSPAIDAGLAEWEVPEGGGALADIGAYELRVPDGGAVGVVLDSVPAQLWDDARSRIAARVINRTSRPLEARLHLALAGVGGATVALDSLVTLPRFSTVSAARTIEIPPSIHAGPASVTARVLVDRSLGGPALLASDAVATQLAHVGDTLRVPGDAPTITEGIALAQDGDLVLVAEGTWFERIDFDGKAIRVLGVAGPPACVIDAQRAGTTVMFQRSEDSLSVLEGFTIAGGYSNFSDDLGGGMHISPGCSPILRNLWFIENETYGSGGGAQVGGGTPRFHRCVFRGNSASALGGGLAVVDSAAHPRVSSCTFYDNRAGEGGALSLAIGALNLEGSLLLANRSYGATTDAPALLLQGSDNVYWANEPAERGPSLIPANRLPGDRDIDPLLRDPDAGYFMPLPRSPLVNAGPAALDPGLAGGPRIDIGAVELPYPLPAPLEVSLPFDLPPLVGGESFDWSYRIASLVDTVATFDIFASIAGGGWSTLVELDPDRASVGAGDTLLIERSDPLPDLLPTGSATMRLQVLDAAGDPVAATVAVTDLTHIPRTLHVPADHSTIASAIEVALHGDTVEVGPGTWNELLRPADRRIVLRSSAGAEATVIDGLGEGPVLVLNEGQDSTTVIEGLTFRGGIADAGAGLLLGGTSPLLRELVVRDNVVPLPPPDPASDLSNTTSTRAEDVVGHGGGVLIAEGSPRIVDSEIRGNGASIGGGLSVFSGTLTMDRTQITRNNASVGGGGIYVGSSALLISTEGSVVDSNAAPWPIRATEADGLDLLPTPAPGGDIRTNTGTSRHAGGIWIEGDVAMSGALIRGNQAWIHDEAGIEVTGSGTLSLYLSEVSANGGDGITFGGSGSLLLHQVAVIDNDRDGVMGSGPLDIDRSWFLRNGRDGVNWSSGIDAAINRSTFVGNAGAGYYAGGWNEGVPLNSNLIVANGFGVYDVDFYPELETRYNNVWGNGDDWYGNSPDPTDISVDPVFVDEEAEDYRMAPSSPLLDAGDPDVALDPDSTRSDIGAGWVDQSSGLVLTVTPERRSYFPRESVLVTYRLTDLGDEGWSVELERSIVGPGHDRIALAPLDFDVPPGGSVAVADSLTIRPDVPLGRYLYVVEIEGLARDEVWIRLE